MKKFATCTAVAVLGGTLALAGARNLDRVTRNLDASNIDTDKKVSVRKADKVVDMTTGQVLPQNGTRAGNVVASDNMFTPENPLVANWSWVDINIQPVCDVTADPNNILGLFDHPLGGDNCAVVQPGGDFVAYFPYLGDCVNEDNKDILWDDYLLDPNITGIDPNQLHVVSEHQFFFDVDNGGVNPALLTPRTFQMRYGFFDLFDFDGNGINDVNGIYGLNLLYDPADPNAQGNGTIWYTIDLSAAPGGGLGAWGAGIWLFDAVDVTVENLEACAMDTPIAGGFEGDPNPICDPAARYTVSTPALSGFFVVLTAAQNGIGQDPNDPNAFICTGPVDPNIDGAPGLSYADVLTGGFGYNLQWTFNAGANNLSNVVNTAISVPGGCAGDVDGDGDTDIDDLLLLLGAFGIGAGGDLDGDGDTDIDDLLILLGDLGCA